MAVRLSALLISEKERVGPRDIVRLEGLGQFKNPMTSTGIEPAAFWLAASCPTLCHVKKNTAHLLYELGYVILCTDNLR
jgi:hypothetical protein